MHVCYSPYTGPDFNSRIPICLSWLSWAVTMSYRKNEFRLKKGYIEAVFFSLLVIYALIFLILKPGNLSCFDSEVNLQK